MPSTYTTNLGVEKPGSGEQSGTWGNTINLNMDIVDRAINGAVSLTLVGATSTLTTADGTLSDGQTKFLRLTGSPGGAHTITVAPNDAQKIYFVTNASDQSAVFSQGSGANVTVLAGNAAAIYCNGGGSGAAVLNMFDALAMGAVAITGGTITGIVDLAVADGGTGASTAAVALTNLGLTATAAEINVLDGVTASTAEINVLDGVTASTAELNFVDGVTGGLQTQLDAKAALASPTFTGVPAGPTAAAATNTTQLATTEFVLTEVAAGGTSRAGEVAWYAVSTAPTGTLKANGAAVSRTTYEALFAVIGTTFGAGNGSTTFNVPDMRGEFARGWDDGRGIDSGRAFGSAQAALLQAHAHTVTINSGFGGFGGIAPGAGGPSAGTVDTGSTGGSETRPRNIALLAVIFF